MRKNLITLLIAAVMLFVFSGCSDELVNSNLKDMESFVSDINSAGQDETQKNDVKVSSDSANKTDSSSKEDKADKSDTADSYIGKEKAKSIALNHASVKADDIYDYSIDFDIDDGTPSYEIEFKSGKYEYDYDIDAKSGKILKSKKEKDDDDDKPVSSPSSTTPSTVASKISEEKAKSIALNHASVKANEIYDYSIEYDIDDGVPSYEIEFKAGKYEYDYDIHAKSGKILKSKKEINDDANKKPASTSTSKISKEEAKSIAFKHASVKAKDVYGLEISLDTDDGIAVYEIEFKSGKYEYKYEINAKTGKILDFDKDIDD